MNQVSARSTFRETLSLPQIVALYIGAVVGSGILFIPEMTAELAGPASILAWMAMSVLVVPTSRHSCQTDGIASCRRPFCCSGASSAGRPSRTHSYGSQLSAASLSVMVQLSLGLYPFLGWSGLYPVAILLIVTAWEWRKLRRMGSVVGNSPE